MTAKVDKNGSANTAVERQINIVRLRPRPRLSSELRRQLKAERELVEKLLPPVADLNKRLERLCESISQDDKPIPVEIKEKEDSLVVNVGEVLVNTR